VLGLVWACSPVIAISMFVLAVAAGLSPTATAWMTRDILDGLVARPAGGHSLRLASPGNGHLIMLAVILCVIGLAGAVMPNAQRYIESQLRRELDVVMRERTYGVINSFPGLSRFESPVFQDKIRMIQQSAQNVPARLISSGLSMTQSVITAVGFFGTLYVISPVLSAIVLATSIPAIAVQIDMSRRRAAAEWLTSGAKRKEFHFGQLLGDSRAAKEVRLFGLGGFLSDLMLSETRTANKRKRSIDRRTLWIEGSLELVAAIVSGAGLIWTVRQALAGRMSVGDISLFIMAVVGVQRGVSTMVSGLADSYQQLIQFGHYDDVISAGPDLPLAAAPSPLPPLREGIELRDVWFRYDLTLPWVLFGLNLRIPAGKSIGLVGLNGAGKSTLVKLLCRFYDPEHGAIYWDGVDIRQVAPEELRARIGTVFQDYMSYELTARENIGVGDLDRAEDLERVQAAAALAGADAAVSRLPDGYDTMLSRVFSGAKDKADRATGVFLSGGQWQRLAIARGMMRSDRDLLILDEPSSGLDAEAEHAIHSRLSEMRVGRTSLLISHRLGSVRDADMIFVLSGGYVAEAGTHDELMTRQGDYHHLFTLQASGYTGDAGTPRPPLRARLGGTRE
jgi:ATP-binding cassette subfamily B protein